MKNVRKYAPHVKVGNKWQRVEGKQAYNKATAVRIYQNWLLAPYLQGVNETRELRPVKPETNEV